MIHTEEAGESESITDALDQLRRLRQSVHV